MGNNAGSSNSFSHSQLMVKTSTESTTIDTSAHASGSSGPVKSLSLKIPTVHLKRPLPTHEGLEYLGMTPSPESVLSGAPSEGSLSPYPNKHKKRRTEHKLKKKNKHKEHKHKHKHRN